MKNEYNIIDAKGNDTVTDLSKGSKEYHIGINYEVGATLRVRADSKEEAEEKVKLIMDYSGLNELENDPTFDTVQRSFDVVEAYNITGKDEDL